MLLCRLLLICQHSSRAMIISKLRDMAMLCLHRAIMETECHHRTTMATASTPKMLATGHHLFGTLSLRGTEQ